MSISIFRVIKGGPGSGNHGHEGRPGQVGGSGAGVGEMSVSELRAYAKENMGSSLNKIKDIGLLRETVAHFDLLRYRMGIPLAEATKKSDERRAAAKAKLEKQTQELARGYQEIETYRKLDTLYVDLHNRMVELGLTKSEERLRAKVLANREKGHEACVWQNARLMTASMPAVRAAVKATGQTPGRTKAANCWKLQPFGPDISSEVGDLRKPSGAKSATSRVLFGWTMPTTETPFVLPPESYFDELQELIEEGDTDAMRAVLGEVDHALKVRTRKTLQVIKGGAGSGNHGHSERVPEVSAQLLKAMQDNTPLDQTVRSTADGLGRMLAEVPADSVLLVTNGVQPDDDAGKSAGGPAGGIDSATDGARHAPMKMLLTRRPAVPEPARKILPLASRRPAPRPVTAPAPAPAEGIVVKALTTDGHPVVGRMETFSIGLSKLRVALPMEDGALMLTDCTLDVPTETIKALAGSPAVREGGVKHFTMTLPWSKAAPTEVKEGKVVVDYLDVVIEGMASTFGHITPADRDGDMVDPSAFSQTVADFMRNPVLLVDHQNSVRAIAGSFTKVNVTRDGLAVRAEISNAPELRLVRFLIAEGHLKAFSIGGLFYFGGNGGKTIEKVNLFEISLVAVPANPDALFQTRSLSVVDVMTEMARREKAAPGLMASLFS